MKIATFPFESIAALDAAHFRDALARLAASEITLMPFGAGEGLLAPNVGVWRP